MPSLFLEITSRQRCGLNTRNGSPIQPLQLGSATRQSLVLEPAPESSLATSNAGICSTNQPIAYRYSCLHDFVHCPATPEFCFPPTILGQVPNRYGTSVLPIPLGVSGWQLSRRWSSLYETRSVLRNANRGQRSFGSRGKWKIAEVLSGR